MEVAGWATGTARYVGRGGLDSTRPVSARERMTSIAETIGAA